MGCSITREEFEEIVSKALDELPGEFKDRLENVDVIIEDEPSREIAGKIVGAHKCLLLGLYQGVPLSKRTHDYGMVMPDKISIFKKNIERMCRTKEDITKTVTHTLQHELAHHLGISDNRLRELGIY
jgi:predicted Zn-dependent protease with MMP-like domain